MSTKSTKPTKPAANKKQVLSAAAENKQLTETLAEIEQLLKQTGLMYNQYFAGNQKRPPVQLRAKIERMLRELAQDPIRNLTLRHRYMNLQATYASLQAVWSTKERERESGKGRKTSAVGARVASFSQKRVAAFLATRGRKTPLKPGEEQKPATEQPAAAQPSPATQQPAAAAPGGGAASVEKLWEKIVGYQLSAGQTLTFESPDQLGRYLTAQKSKIEQQTGIKGVQLRLAIEDGKLKFKARLPGDKSAAASSDPLPE